MSRGFRRRLPAVVAAVVALMAALGGTVYAAGKINGHAVKVKSLPGNRLALRSLPGNRLKPGSIRGEVLAPGSVGAAQLAPGSVTSVQLDLASLGQVPDAAHADRADVALSAKDAETALSAGTAEDAKTLDGYEAGCKPGTRLFAGACWQNTTNGSAVTPTAAATSCASQGGELPNALALAAFAKEPGITIAAPEEWTGDIPTVSGEDVYAVATVEVSGAINSSSDNSTRKFRCVIPLLS
ncbi:MAG TPA: hypothetical protein VFP21_08245 [Solirubrobacterales bacterium]|nr:hypothetical protein [Solirubrobacterales bacterium]